MIKFLKSRIEGFGFGFSGLKDILTTEHNAWIHLYMTIVVILLSLWLQISAYEFILIIFAIALVWVTEAINTVLEIVVNMVTREYSEGAKRAKDIAAAAVLVAAIASAVIGLLILGPPLLAKL